MTRKTSKPLRLWAVCRPDEIALVSTLAFTRSDAIKKWLAVWRDPKPWRHYRRSEGMSCRRVKIVVKE